MARKSRGKYHSSSYRMPALERSDLVEIEQRILNDLKPERYHLACRGTEYDRVEDVAADCGKVYTFVIYTHNPCLRLKFARSWAELYCEEINEDMTIAVRKIDAVVVQRERRMFWWLAKFSIWIAPLLGFGVLSEIVILTNAGRLPHQALYGGVGFLVLSYLWWLVSYRATFFRFSRLNLSQ